MYFEESTDRWHRALDAQRAVYGDDEPNVVIDRTEYRDEDVFGAGIGPRVPIHPTDGPHIILQLDGRFGALLFSRKPGQISGVFATYDHPTREAALAAINAGQCRRILL